MNAILLMNAISTRLLRACVKKDALWVGGYGRWYCPATSTYPNLNPNPSLIAGGLLVFLHTPYC